MTEFTHNGLRLAYDDSAARPAHTGATARHERPALLLLHGWGNGRVTMRPLARALAGSFRTIALDQPGHGESEPPPGGRARGLLSVQGQAASAAALLDHLGVERAVLVGHSSGGAVAVELAARRPELARAVVALDGTILLVPAILASGPTLLAALQSPHWRGAMTEQIRRGYLSTDDPCLMAAQLDQLARISRDDFAALPETLGCWDDVASLRAVAAHDIPMLYVDASSMVRLADMAALVPQLRVEEIIGLGHMQLIGHPELALDAMSDFFADVERDAGAMS